MSPVILFDESIDAENYRELAQRHIREAAALFDADDWPAGSTRGGVTISTRPLEYARPSPDPGGGVETSTALTVRAGVDVRAPRAAVFDLVSRPSRAPEWDTTDLGHDWIERFDADHGVFCNRNKAPLLAPRDILLVRVARPDFAAGRSLYSVRSVVHADCPPSSLQRIRQQLFAWDVRDAGDPSTCTVTVVVSVPQNMLPKWLLDRAFAPGWRGILGKIKQLSEPS